MSDVAYDPRGSRQAGVNYAAQLINMFGNARAGRQLASGDRQGAARTMYQFGNLDGGLALEQQAIQQQQAQRAREAETVLRVTSALRQVQSGGGDIGAALDSYRPILSRMGVDDNAYGQLRGLIASDKTALDQIERLYGRAAPEWQARDGGAGDVVAFRNNPDGTFETRLAYDAPDRPISTPYGIILPPGAAGGNVPDARGNPPITGAAIQPNAPVSAADMVGITAQAESGGRERYANGQLVTSPAGAQGMMQVMPGTNADPGFGVTPARDGSDAERTRVGRDYLAAMMQRYGNDPAKAWAAYNGGPGRLDAAISRYGGDWLSAMPAETQAYVQNNLAALNGGGQVDQGSEQYAGPEVQALGNGWNLQPMQTPAERRADRQFEAQQARWAREDARNARQDQIQAQERLSDRQSRNFGQANDLRSQYNADASVKTYNTIRPQVGVIQNIASRAASGQQISAQDDLALIFAYMKLLDPGSVVREGEFANAQNTGGVDDRVVNAYNNALRGNRLNDQQRREFAASAQRVADGYAQQAEASTNRYRGLARGYGINPDEVAPAFQRPQQPGRRQTNAPGLPFNISEGQLRTRQQIVAAGGTHTAPLGSRLNPRYLNPADPSVGWARVQPGEYFVAPDGRLRQRP